MKRMLAVATLVVGLVAQSFATNTKDESKVSISVIKNFNNNFSSAENVSWKVTEKFVKASFELEGDVYEAFYTPIGEFMGTTKTMEYKKLPKKALKTLAVKYPSTQYTVKECLLYTDVEGNNKYFASFINNGKKIIVEIGADGSIQPFTKS